MSGRASSFIPLQAMSREAADMIKVKVTARASSNMVKTEELPDGTTLYKVYTTVVPENGKANLAVIKLLAEYFKVSRSSISIVQGQTNRNKIVRLQR